ncbi:MAG: hypothetical protein ABSA39_08715 [Edaphobacter sp.]
MPESTDPNLSASLPQRFDGYATTVEDIVLRGIEHPACELKRAVNISRGGDRLEFLKLVQGHANSHTKGERLIVIGADQKEKKFYNVENAKDFDAARISPILAKYFSPEPIFEVFNMKASDGETYVLVVLAAAQPRPILVLTDGEADSKTYFRSGDIWIKHNTGLKPASSSDLDLMYEPKIDREAEKRARQRFDHFRETLGPALLSQAVESTPAPELLIGSRERLGRFAEAMISSGEPAKFNMLLEMARQIVVERWDSLLQGSNSSYGISEEKKSQVSTFYRNEFMPAVVSLVDLGLNLVRYGSPEWFESIGNVMTEAFVKSCQIDHLKAINDSGDETVPFARPAYEIYLGLRTLSTYAVARKRLSFLSKVLPRYVHRLSSGQQGSALEPILFWPFRGALNLPEMKSGRNEEIWEQSVGSYWPDVFGTKEKFLSAAAQLEFVLELNSYLILRSDKPAFQKLRDDFPEKQLGYLPDFWRSRLDPSIPMAETIYDSMLSDVGFPATLSVEPQVTAAAFQGTSPGERAEFFGCFLKNLRAWQDSAMMQQQRFPFHFAWPGRLHQAVERCTTPVQL